jgi:hypothetical protein
MGTYINQVDLENALSPQTVAEIFNDSGDGEFSQVAMEAIIDRAEAEVDSRLPGFYTYPLVAPIDRMIRHAATTYAMAFSFERHPEYVRQFGENDRVGGMYKRGERLMDQIQSRIKVLADQPSPTTAPKNSGGIVYDRGPRFCIDSADGTPNGDGF